MSSDDDVLDHLMRLQVATMGGDVDGAIEQVRWVWNHARAEEWAAVRETAKVAEAALRRDRSSQMQQALERARLPSR
jgi:hypothetical protein